MLFVATKAHYADLLKRLSPVGKFWATLTPGLSAIYQAIGATLARVHNAAASIWTEALPGETVTLLDQWLAEYGLPEPGMTLPASVDDRRALLLAKINAVRGQSPARMIELARLCGVTATVDEWFDTGRPLTWRFVMGTDCVRFRCGIAHCGDKLLDFTDAGTAAMQQVQRAKPVHTRVEYWDV